MSDQAVRLWKEGWFQPQDAPCGESKLRNPQVSDRTQSYLQDEKGLDAGCHGWQLLCEAGIKDFGVQL